MKDNYYMLLFKKKSFQVGELSVSLHFNYIASKHPVWNSHIALWMPYTSTKALLYYTPAITGSTVSGYCLHVSSIPFEVYGDIIWNELCKLWNRKKHLL